jgi:hypothetical protein
MEAQPGTGRSAGRAGLARAGPPGGQGANVEAGNLFLTLPVARHAPKRGALVRIRLSARAKRVVEPRLLAACDCALYRQL